MIELLLLEHYRLCRCSVVIVILRLANYRLRRCNVLIDLLLLENYRLCRCSVVIEKLPANFRSCKCDALSLVCYHYIAFQHFFLAQPAAKIPRAYYCSVKQAYHPCKGRDELPITAVSCN